PRRPLSLTLFPYTTLFRSRLALVEVERADERFQFADFDADTASAGPSTTHGVLLPPVSGSWWEIMAHSACSDCRFEEISSWTLPRSIRSDCGWPGEGSHFPRCRSSPPMRPNRTRDWRRRKSRRTCWPTHATTG